MSVTTKVIQFVDKLKLNKFFTERNGKVYFQLAFNPKKFESIIDKTLRVNGRPYKVTELEKQALEELESRP